MTWIIAFVVDYSLRFYLGRRQGQQWEVNWKAVAIAATAVAGLVVLIVQRLREEPTKEELAALGAILQAGPGTIGAVVVTRNGAPEVIPTVCSREEYLELAGSGRLLQDHTLFLPDDA